MKISVNTNLASLTAQKSLSSATSRMNTAMERMTTGYKINSSKDDAAGMAVSSKLEYKLGSLKVAQDNVQMGSTLIETEEGVLGVINDNLTRIRDLTEQAANGTYGSDALSAIRIEVQARMDEITRISQSAEYNGKYLLNPKDPNGIKTDIKLQVGIKSDENSIIKLDKELFTSTNASAILNIKSGKLEGADDKYKNNDTARDFLPNIDNAIATITDRLTKIGGIQQRLLSAADIAETMESSVTNSLSTIKDADIAEESSNYVKEQILQQLSTSMLATANQSPAIALNLV